MFGWTKKPKPELTKTAKKKCSWLDCDSPAAEECIYCGRKYCIEHSVNHELERHGNKT